MKLLSFGEVLWDIIEGVDHIGGAPFNVAAHAVRLGAEAALVSAVGPDERGDRALRAARDLGVDTRFVRRNDQPTGIVPVTLDPHGHPTFEIVYPAAWDFIEIADADLDSLHAQGFDCFCFGVLSQRSPATRQALRRLLARCSFCTVLCDVNLRQDYYDRERIEESVRAAHILKLNHEEAEVVGDLLDLPGDETDICRGLMREHGVAVVCVTAGAEGCRLYSEDGVVACPGVEVEVADTVGSGDAFAAAFLKKLTEGAPLQEAARYANRLGALVASRRGAVPEYDLEELR